MSTDDGGAEDDLLLSEQACFALYSASRAVTDVYRPLLAELGLTYPQYLVLLTLWESEPRTVRDVGAALALDYGTVSPLLKRLEGAGFVERRRAPHDERTVTVHLTDAGRDLRARVSHVPRTIGCALGLDDRARHELIVLLRTITASTVVYRGVDGASSAS
ncbi:MarR family transcriptional regulator [Actinomycetospora sp. NBRC 106375]|uniref:MarR family winged helix-turn-helix transcriptional regulator n=1 Tax=Actinomycetospora sp. NBRC 106375 TaxID=3032207 RepID=UPI0024A3F3DC|nr:MarR family winged helix-turn-helix transcriptional regulator [Actinomycetospora sp. NBRC 106375]GLZ44815.1 MarR family transcriptional regulator [Actinomycetospora sp. NBRC 106375]